MIKGGINMSTVKEISAVTPYGDTDDILQMIIDQPQDAYRLHNVVHVADTYTFSIWHKSEQSTTITFTVCGHTEQVISSSEWAKYVTTITVETLDDTNIFIAPEMNAVTYFYEGSLVRGGVDASWLPAPEDIFDTMYAIESSFEQRADSIELSVKQKGKMPTSFRYLRDWLNGSTVDTGNHWVNCIINQHQSDGSEINVALNKSVEAFDQNGNSIFIDRASIYTNGELLLYPDDISTNVMTTAEDIPVDTSYAYTESGKYCLQVDLGAIYTDISTIKVWHYYHDGRQYNHTLEVSTDGKTWITIYDSDVHGIYAERVEGKFYLVDETSIYSSIASLQVELGSISSTVEGLNSSASAWLTENSFNLTIGKNLNDRIQSLPTYEDLNGVKQDAINTAKQDTALLIEASEEKITSQFQNEYGQVLSQVKQSTDDWTATFRRKFAEIGMDEYEDVYTNFIVSSEGAEVKSVDENNIVFGTRMKLNGFDGYYGEEVVFKIDKDKVHTYRVYNRGGIDFAPVDATANEMTANGGIKYVPRVFYDSNNNKRHVLCHVRSGGSS